MDEARGSAFCLEHCLYLWASQGPPALRDELAVVEPPGPNAHLSAVEPANLYLRGDHGRAEGDDGARTVSGSESRYLSAEEVFELVDVFVGEAGRGNGVSRKHVIPAVRATQDERLLVRRRFHPGHEGLRLVASYRTRA